MAILDLLHPSISSNASTSSTIEPWHVAVTRPGMFPMDEARCPCEKAPCGLVIPHADIPCEVHHAYAELHQAHSSDECGNKRRGFFRQRKWSQRAHLD